MAEQSAAVSSRRPNLRVNPKKTEKYITMIEALQETTNARIRNLVVLPPESGDRDVPSDEEEFPDTEEGRPTEVAGNVEVDYDDSSSGDSDDESNETINAGRRSGNARWRKNDIFDEVLPKIPCPNVLTDYPLLTGFTEYDTWRQIFDTRMLELILDQTMLYAHRDKSDVAFQSNLEDMNHFIGILLFSGYHTVPKTSDYWSNQPDLGVPFIKDNMSRNSFTNLKSNVHLADNRNLTQGNI